MKDLIPTINYDMEELSVWVNDTWNDFCEAHPHMAFCQPRTLDETRATVRYVMEDIGWEELVVNYFGKGHEDRVTFTYTNDMYDTVVITEDGDKYNLYDIYCEFEDIVYDVTW